MAWIVHRVMGIHYLKLSLVDFTCLKGIRLSKDVAICIVAQLCLLICCSAADDQANQIKSGCQCKAASSSNISKKLRIDRHVVQFKEGIHYACARTSLQR